MTDRVIDLLDPETHADNPWPLYEWMREEAPLYFDAENGVWCVSRYDDIIRVARDPKTFTSVEGNRPNLPYDGSFIHLDGKGHHERRNLVVSHVVLEWWWLSAAGRRRGVTTAARGASAADRTPSAPRVFGKASFYLLPWHVRRAFVDSAGTQHGTGPLVLI